MRLGNRAALLVVGVGLMLLSGCGLDIMVMTDNSAPQAGDQVEFTIMLKNQTNCQVTDAFLLVSTFITPEQLSPSVNFCSFLNGVGIGDIEGLEAELGKIMSPEAVASLMQSAQDRFFGTSEGSGQTIAVCQMEDPEPGEPPTFECDLGPIDPLEKETVTFTAEAPQAGSIRTIALAFGDIPSDEACRPGVPELGLVAGCFDSALASRPAPAMSFGGLLGTVLALAGLGVYAISWRWR